MIWPQMAQLVKNLPAMRETRVQPLGWEDPPGGGRDYPLQYSGLENSMDCIVHGVTKSRTRPSDFHFHTFTSPRAGSSLRLSEFLGLGQKVLK